MEQNEENKTTNIQQQFISKYQINSMTIQENKSIDSLSNNHLNSKEYFQHIEKMQEYLLNLNQQNLLIPKSNINQDSMYWERRKKNNEAAKRSRDARRIKEDEIALRATLLEQENVKLRLENTHLKYENLQLRYQIYKTIKS